MKDSQKYLTNLPSINEKSCSIQFIGNHNINSSIRCPLNSNLSHDKNCNLCQQKTTQVTNVCAGYLPCCVCQANKIKQKEEFLNYFSKSIQQQAKINKQLKRLTLQLSAISKNQHRIKSHAKKIKSSPKQGIYSVKKLIVETPQIKYKKHPSLKKIKSNELLQKEIKRQYYFPQVYKDSQHRNRKHQRDHLIYTYQQQTKLRSSFIEKLKSKSQRKK